MKPYFDHEKLDGYQESIAFCGWVGDLLGEISTKAAAKDQLDRASISLPLNIAEGDGKLSTVDRSSAPHALMCLQCESLSLLNASSLRRNRLSELLTCRWEC
ncbi:MAG: hypothetical protein C5B58_04410 [Acidobacteria bacterium]|nr:MAG: hypothetical protein C5B58_04410 [Acidobacteriota bacterium]